MSLNRILRLAPVWCLALSLFCAAPVSAQSTPANTELSAAVEAINELNLAKLKALLDKSPTLVKQREAEEEADTLLHHAVRRGILSGGGLSYQDSAALVAIVKLLIERKSNVNARDRGNDTPLSYAVRWRRNIEGAKVLLAGGADLTAKLPGLHGLEGSGGTVLHQAVAAVDLQMVKFLIESKADVNAKDGAGNTPLITNAATRGHSEQPEIAKALIAVRAAVNTQNIYGETALFKAAQESVEVVQVLLANGADPNLTTREGTSPAQVAIDSLDSRVTLRLLIKYKAALNIVDKEGRTLLHKASMTSDSNAAEVLIENGSDINAKDTEGFTPLILAVSDEMLTRILGDTRVPRGSREDVVELLLKSGANANLPDRAGNTAGHYAAKENRRVILRLLLENKGDPNHRNNKGETPLHLATLYDRVAIAKLLLANKGSAIIKDQEGKTALDWAKQYGREEIAALLGGK